MCDFLLSNEPAQWIWKWILEWNILTRQEILRNLIEFYFVGICTPSEATDINHRYGIIFVCSRLWLVKADMSLVKYCTKMPRLKLKPTAMFHQLFNSLAVTRYMA